MDRHGTNIHALLATRRQIARMRHQQTTTYDAQSASQAGVTRSALEPWSAQNAAALSERASAQAATTQRMQSQTADRPPHFDQQLLLPSAPCQAFGASRASAAGPADKKTMSIVGQETFVLGRERLQHAFPKGSCQTFTGSPLSQQKASAAGSAAKEALAASRAALDKVTAADLEKWKRRRLGVLRLRLLGETTTAATKEERGRDEKQADSEMCSDFSAADDTFEGGGAPLRRRVAATRTWTAQRLARTLATSKQELGERALTRARGIPEAADALNPSLRLPYTPSPPPTGDMVSGHAARAAARKEEERKEVAAASAVGHWQMRSEWAAILGRDHDLNQLRQVAHLERARETKAHKQVRAIEEAELMQRVKRQERTDRLHLFLDLVAVKPSRGSSARSTDTLWSARTQRITGTRCALAPLATARDAGTLGERWGRWGTKGVEGWGSYGVVEKAGGASQERVGGGPGEETGGLGLKNMRLLKKTRLLNSFRLRIESKWKYISEGGGRRERDRLMERDRLIESLRAQALTPDHLIFARAALVTHNKLGPKFLTQPLQYLATRVPSARASCATNVSITSISDASAFSWEELQEDPIFSAADLRLWLGAEGLTFSETTLVLDLLQGGSGERGGGRGEGHRHEASSAGHSSIEPAALDSESERESQEEEEEDDDGDEEDTAFAPSQFLRGFSYLISSSSSPPSPFSSYLHEGGDREEGGVDGEDRGVQEQRRRGATALLRALATKMTHLHNEVTHLHKLDLEQLLLNRKTAKTIISILLSEGRLTLPHVFTHLGGGVGGGVVWSRNVSRVDLRASRIAHSLFLSYLDQAHTVFRWQVPAAQEQNKVLLCCLCI
jgi:hypothetical protein